MSSATPEATGPQIVALDVHHVRAPRAVGKFAAVADRGVAFDAPGARHQLRALRPARALRDHVDDADESVRAIQRGARTRNHLDAIHVLEHHVLRIPQHAGKHGGVEHAAVHQHQQLVGDDVQEAARGDRVGRGTHARHFQVRREAQRLRAGSSRRSGGCPRW
jgi:hypothetical protein